MRHLIFAAALMTGLIWVYDTYAATMTVTCSPPKGLSFRYELGKEVKVLDGGFPGVNPIFVIEGDKKDTALVVFGSAKIPVLPGFDIPTNAERATIVISNDIQISMISILGDQLWSYSLYPKHGYGLFSYQSRELPILQNHVALSGMYQSKCQFSEK